MRTEEWREVCRERARRGGLVSAQRRREAKAEKDEADRRFAIIWQQILRDRARMAAAAEYGRRRNHE